MTYSPVTLESLLSHQSWALRVARRLVREEDEAEDLVQRTWMAALRRPPQSQVGAKAWIRKVILNLARERHRRNQSRVRHESARSAEDEPTSSEAFETVSRSEIHRLLSERLLQLDEPYRTVVLQRFYEDLTSVEIAQRLGIPPGTVRWRLKIGLDQLRAEFDRRSQGDRSRWVSALVAFVRPPGAETRPLAEESVRSPISALSTSTLAWTMLGTAGLLGIFFLRGGLEPARIPALAAEREAPPTGEGPAQDGRLASFAAPGERLPVAEIDPAEGPALRVTAAPHGLALRVVTPEGEPAPGAAIHVARSDGFELRSHCDEDGRAWLVPEPGDLGGLGLESTRGRLSVRAVAAGRGASDLLHVSAPFTPEHEVLLTVGGPEMVLRGRVSTPEGAAVPGALVAWFVQKSYLQLRPEGDFSSSSYLSVRTDEQGRFALPNLSRRGGVVACFASGFAIYARYLEALDVRSFDIVLDRGATLVGTVRHPNGAPAADIVVKLESIWKTAEWATGLPGYEAHCQGFYERTRTDARGRFRLAGVNTLGQPRTLWAVDEENGRMATLTLRIEPGSEVVWDAELADLPSLKLRLVDEVGQPLAGMLAHLRQQSHEHLWARRLYADEAGRVEVLDCPSGQIYLDVFAPLGAGTSLGWRRLQASTEEQLLVFSSRRLVTIRGRLLDPSGKPEPRGELVALSMDTSLETTIPREVDGTFRLALPNGYYLLLLRIDQTAGKLVEFRCRSGSDANVGDLVTPELGSLRLEAPPSGAAEAMECAVFKISEEDEPKGSLLVWGGWLRDSVTHAMFPGRYEVLLHEWQGRPLQRTIVRVRSGEETRLETWHR